MYGGGPLRIGEWIASGLSAALGVLLLAALIAVGVLLVRFLLVGTRAAQLYLDRHESRAPATPPAAPAPPAASSVVPPAASAPAPAAPAAPDPPAAPSGSASVPVVEEPPPAAPKSALDHAAGGATGTVDPPADAPTTSTPKPRASRSSTSRSTTPRAPRAPRTPPSA